jgi:Fe-S cluster assembly ATP-binding protein
MAPLLDINNLHVEIDGEEILHGVDITVDRGEVHALMGPNGSGKSTLAKAVAGREEFEITEGDILFNGESVLDLEPEERALAGIFMAFQYPVEIPGVKNVTFMKSAVNEVREARGKEPLDAMEFNSLAKETMEDLGLDTSLLTRPLNAGFSGGEKKKNEIFQLAMLEPELAVLDETDSGLDIDALQVVADGVNKLRESDRGFLLITHYERILEYIVPDRVHVLVDGEIAKSGDKELAHELEEKGYGWVEDELVA